MFEEEYRKAAGKPKYRTLFNDVDLQSDATEVHYGHFSIDKKGAWTDTAERATAIMRNVPITSL